MREMELRQNRRGGWIDIAVFIGLLTLAELHL